MLEADRITTYYGNACALREVSFEVNEGEIVSIIGANGAGKSTLMKSIMGVVKPRTGAIRYKGKELLHFPTHKIVGEGIVYVPEGRDVFAPMSVQDNLEMGAYSQPFSKSQTEELCEEMYQMFPRLKERRKQTAGTLSGGEQQMLAIARGLMSKPEIIMFDEPSLGLAPIVVDEVFERIKYINQELKISVVLVEQNAYMALTISDRSYVMENGRIAKYGASQELLHDDSIKTAYLGM
ncbi:MAG: ABC transporter ATP-binding protein [Lachnospiraceae bacterium]|jgi:branched-chain amino acid transport system ATP-binding protein|nr:ABC transporter ATP-binding protein [Lachnospiraceae bacterium]